MALPAGIGDVSFALQPAKGTPAAVGQFRLHPSGGTMPHAVAELQSLAEMSGQRMQSGAFIGEVGVAFSTQYHVRPESIAPLLFGVLGAQAVAGIADPYTHTFTPASTLPYWTFFKMLGNGLAEKFADCIITKLVLHGESFQPLTVTVDGIGLTPSYLTVAEATATPEATNHFTHSDAAGALRVEGDAMSCISAFDITIDNNASSIPGDSITACDINIGELMVEAGTTQTIDDFAMWNRAHYGSPSPSNGAAHITTPLELGGSPAGLAWKWTRLATSRTLEILVPRVLIPPFDVQGSVGNDPLTVQFPYRAYQPVSGASITAVVLNSKAGLYAAA